MAPSPGLQPGTPIRASTQNCCRQKPHISGPPVLQGKFPHTVAWPGAQKYPHIALEHLTLGNSRKGVGAALIQEYGSRVYVLSRHKHEFS